jgi:hypothetical protein
MKRSQKQLSSQAGAELTSATGGHPDAAAVDSGATSYSSKKKNRIEPGAQSDEAQVQAHAAKKKPSDTHPRDEDPSSAGAGAGGGPSRHRSVEAHHRRRARAKENKKRRKLLLKAL